MLITKKSPIHHETWVSDVPFKTVCEPLPVVSVGRDEKLLDLREQIFRSIGLEVQSMNPSEAYCLAHSSEARVWVFCSTIGLGELIYLANTIRTRSPQSRLLLLEDIQLVGAEATLFHCIFNPIMGIDTILERIRELATER